uniref:Uncharacterized protein n=1 Tax=Glossina palpalis gambiensis TaxID=67801 RepID=A0A1B0BIN9_9MUSC
ADLYFVRKQKRFLTSPPRFERVKRHGLHRILFYYFLLLSVTFPQRWVSADDAAAAFVGLAMARDNVLIVALTLLLLLGLTALYWCCNGLELGRPRAASQSCSCRRDFTTLIFLESPQICYADDEFILHLLPAVTSREMAEMSAGDKLIKIFKLGHLWLK